MRTLKILALSTGVTVAATAVTACGITEQECNRNSLGITFSGTVQIEDPVEVAVCHGYWNQLDVGTYRGQPTRCGDQSWSTTAGTVICLLPHKNVKRTGFDQERKFVYSQVALTLL